MKEIQSALKHPEQALEEYWCEDGLEEAEFCRRLYHIVVEAQNEMAVRGYGVDSRQDTLFP